ncbi:MAG: OmpW/AlkL family protein [Rhodoferax sp.]
MKTQLKFLALAAALATTTGAGAQTAGTWMVRAGLMTLAPQVNSGFLSKPDFYEGSKVDVRAATQVGGGISYMYTDNISVDVPFALPFKHKIVGAGAIKGEGDIGEVQALPATVFLQYRFLESTSAVRPYVGLGATYAYFFNPQGSGRLTATLNPGGPPSSFTVDSKFIVTPQIGATFAVNDKWFVDVFYSKSKLNTRTTFADGHTIDADLDPISYGIAVGTKF